MLDKKKIAYYFYPSPAASGDLSHKGRGEFIPIFHLSSYEKRRKECWIKDHLSPYGRGRHEVTGEGFLV